MSNAFKNSCRAIRNDKKGVGRVQRERKKKWFERARRVVLHAYVGHDR